MLDVNFFPVILHFKLGVEIFDRLALGQLFCLFLLLINCKKHTLIFFSQHEFLVEEAKKVFLFSFFLYSLLESQFPFLYLHSLCLAFLHLCFDMMNLSTERRFFPLELYSCYLRFLEEQRDLV